VPLDVVFVIDASGSMMVSGRMDFAKQAARSFVTWLKPIDRAQIVVFEDTFTDLTGLTANKAGLVKAVESIKSGGATALYAALGYALMTPREPGRQRAVIVLSDGQNNTGALSFTQVEALARANASSVYAITLEGEGLHVSELALLAKETGGAVSRVVDPGTLPDVYARIKSELSSKYQLSYYAQDAAAGVAPVVVELPKRRGLFLRATRSGAY